MQHQDSHGGGRLIADGATQWMTAGGGILHIETPPEELVVSGGSLHGFQLWVNLPAAHKMRAPGVPVPRGRRRNPARQPRRRVAVRSSRARWTATPAPVRRSRPITLVHATVTAGARLEVLPWRADFNALVYVLSGRGRVGRGGDAVRKGQLALLGPGGAVRVDADAQQDSHEPTLDVLLMGGLPIREPLAQYGPFVMNTRAELQAGGGGLPGRPPRRGARGARSCRTPRADRTLTGP